MTDAMLAFELAPEQRGLTWPDLPRDASTLANASEANAFVLGEAAPRPGAEPPQWRADGRAPFAAGWRRLWLTHRPSRSNAVEGRKEVWSLRTTIGGRKAVQNAFVVSPVCHESK